MGDFFHLVQAVLRYLQARLEHNYKEVRGQRSPMGKLKVVKALQGCVVFEIYRFSVRVRQQEQTQRQQP